MTSTQFPTGRPGATPAADRSAPLHERLAVVDLLVSCTRRERRIVARHCEVVDVPAGTVLARRGDQPLNVFLVLDGALVRRSATGTVRPVGPGDQHGALELLTATSNPDDLSTVTGSSVAVVGARGFKVLVRELAPLNQTLMTTLAAQVLASERDAPGGASRSRPLGPG